MKNFQIETDKITKSIDIEHKPSLLLQSCCGPCSSYVLEYLCQYFAVTILFYNPNIQPETEYIKRLETQKSLLSHLPAVKFMDCSYEGEAFDKATLGYEHFPEGGARCSICFNLRLDKTAKLAHDLNFDYFATTLTVSPHKNSEIINGIGETMAKKHGSTWLPSDFKKRNGYKRSIELSREYELYRQDYCGCLFSKI